MSYPPSIEHAKSGRATCKCCREKIAKGELRIGFNSERDGYMYTRWHHVKCAGVVDPDTLLGFELLSSDEKDMVLRFITKSGSSSHKMSQSPLKTFQSQESSSYPPTIEHAKSGRSTCKARGCREKIAEGELRIGFSRDRDGYIYTRWHHVRCAGQVNPDTLEGFDALTEDEKKSVLCHIVKTEWIDRKKDKKRRRAHDLGSIGELPGLELKVSVTKSPSRKKKPRIRALQREESETALRT